MQPTIDMVSLSILTLKKDRFEFLRKIRAATRNTLVIVMTVGDVNYLDFATQLGVVDSLAKPIDEQKLIVPIQNVV
jgi:DNA-binding NtrC family response regulator